MVNTGYENRLRKEDYLRNRPMWIEFIKNNSMFVKSTSWESCYLLKQPLTNATNTYLYMYDMMELLREMGFSVKVDKDGYPMAKAKLSSKFKKRCARHELIS